MHRIHDVLREIPADNYMTAFFGACFIIFSVASLWFRRFRQLQRHTRLALTTLGIMVGLCFLLSGSIGGLYNASMRLDFRQTLERVGADEFTLSVNGVQIRESELYVEELMKVTASLSRRSKPTQSYYVEILSQQRRLDILLQRDSRINDEYWTFWKRGEGRQHVGTIKSRTLGAALANSELDWPLR